MFIELVWWDLRPEDPHIDLLRSGITESVLKSWSQVSNLRLKLWIADERNCRWGALMVWCGLKPPLVEMPPNITADLIGRPPTSRLIFTVEAEYFQSEQQDIIEDSIDDNTK